MHRHQLEVSSFAPETRDLGPESSTGLNFINSYVFPVYGRVIHEPTLLEDSWENVFGAAVPKPDGNGPFPQKHPLFVLSKPLILWS